MHKIAEFVKKLLGLQSARYLISSCAAFAVNYAVALVLNRLFEGITAFSVEIATAISFAISSQVNFWINRRWVFRSEKPPLPELGGYYSLALISFALKTYVFIEIMYRLIKLPLAVAMPVAEVIMFAVNYFVQKKIIFRRKSK